MKKSMGVLGAAFLGLGMAVAAPLFAQDEVVELTQQDKEMIGLLAKYRSCIDDRMSGAVQRENLPNSLLEEMVSRKNATITKLKAKDPEMSEGVINLILGLESLGMITKWTQETCTAEMKLDHGAIKRRIKEVYEQGETDYGRKFFETLNAPKPQ